MFITICDSYKIKQVDMASIINTIDGILLNYVIIFHMFLEWNLLFLYYSFTNDEYITIDEHYHISIASIRSVILMMFLSNGISKLIFINALHILTSRANLISLGILP